MHLHATILSSLSSSYLFFTVVCFSFLVWKQCISRNQMHNSISQNGFSLVLLISSIQTVKGLTGQPSVASGNPPEKIVRLEAPTPTLSLPQRRLLFTTKVAFHVVRNPTGLFTNTMLSPFTKARLVHVLENFNTHCKLSFFIFLHCSIASDIYQWIF